MEWGDGGTRGQGDKGTRGQGDGGTTSYELGVRNIKSSVVGASCSLIVFQPGI